MNIFRKFLILLIIIICLCIVYKLYQDRISVYKMMSSSNKIEGFTNSTVTSLEKKNVITPKISSYPFKNMTAQFGVKDPAAKQLNQFCIKSSCNSCYDGTDVSLDMLQYVLSRGCRFLDFEIYWGTPTVKDSKGQITSGAVVSVSNDPTTPEKNCLSLYSVFNYLQHNCFNSGVSPNYQDPLFIQIRVKYLIYLNQTNKQNVLYDSIASTIQQCFGNIQYSGNIDGETDLSTIGQQVVVVMDTYANRDYVGVSPNLADVINMESNSNVLTQTTYDEAITQTEMSYPIDANGVVTNMTIMQQVLPMSISNTIQYLFTDNFDAMSIISRYSAQITPMLFWSNDSYLQAYESMFNKTGTGIVRLSSAMNYADGQQVIPAIAFP